MNHTPAPHGYPIKLVRDNTPSILNSTGQPGTLFYTELRGGESLRLWLRKKLGEEVTEYLLEPRVGELVHVLLVVEALSEYHGYSLDELTELMRSDPRGGYTKGVMMRGHHEEFDGQP